MARMYGHVFNCSRGCCWRPKSYIKRLETEQWQKDAEEELNDDSDCIGSVRDDR
jgi:hypothetical protein